MNLTRRHANHVITGLVLTTLLMVLAACGGSTDATSDSIEPADAATTESQGSTDQSLAVRTGTTTSVTATTPSSATTAATDVPGGAGVYVDAAAGNDKNAGTMPSPWKTLAKLTAVRLASGQGIYLRCGSTWRLR